MFGNGFLEAEYQQPFRYQYSLLINQEIHHSIIAL